MTPSPVFADREDFIEGLREVSWQVEEAPLGNGGICSLLPF